MSAAAEVTPIVPAGAMPPVQTLIGKDGTGANGLAAPPATALPLAPTRDKQSNETVATTGDTPAETRTSWQSALPRELRELAQTPAPHPELARRHADGTMQTLAERTMLLRAAGQSGASVTLEPESLGRVDVHVRVHSDTTHVSFTVQHAAVRDVVEANLPRLRTMLEDAGLTLGDVNVGHSDQGWRQSRFDGERRVADGGTMAREDASPSHLVSADRLVDVRV
jgi:flagellar hook-length control protein FliK